MGRRICRLDGETILAAYTQGLAILEPFVIQLGGSCGNSLQGDGATGGKCRVRRLLGEGRRLVDIEAHRAALPVAWTVADNHPACVEVVGGGHAGKGEGLGGCAGDNGPGAGLGIVG